MKKIIKLIINSKKTRDKIHEVLLIKRVEQVSNGQMFQLSMQLIEDLEKKGLTIEEVNKIASIVKKATDRLS